MNEYLCESCKTDPMEFFYNRMLLCPICYVVEKELEEGSTVELEEDEFNWDDFGP